MREEKTGLSHSVVPRAVDFSAGARTHSGTDVMLSVESGTFASALHGAATAESPLSFVGEGAARWLARLPARAR
jgi:hypothetical protein